jgi:hypothetical protein
MPKHNNGFDCNAQASRRVLQSDNEIHTFQIYTKFLYLYNGHCNCFSTEYDNVYPVTVSQQNMTMSTQ